GMIANQDMPSLVMGTTGTGSSPLSRSSTETLTRSSFLPNPSPTDIPRTRMKMIGMARRITRARASRTSKRMSFFANFQTTIVHLITQRPARQVEEDPFQIGFFGFKTDEIHLQIIEQSQELQKDRFGIFAAKLEISIAFAELSVRQFAGALAQFRRHGLHAKANQARQLAKKILQGIAGDDLAVVDDADARAQGLHLFHVMAGIDDGHTLLVEAADFLED